MDYSRNSHFHARFPWETPFKVFFSNYYKILSWIALGSPPTGKTAIAIYLDSFRASARISSGNHPGIPPVSPSRFLLEFLPQFLQGLLPGSLELAALVTFVVIPTIYFLRS